MRRHALTGLPGPVERRLLDRYGRTAPSRIALAAAVKALTVLLKRHPRAALDMAAAAAIQAGRVGVQGITERLAHLEGKPSEVDRPQLSRREVRRFIRMLQEKEFSGPRPNYGAGSEDQT
jgi:hypothetical protein